MMDSPSQLSQLFSPSQQMISDDIWHKIAHIMNIGLKKENELTRLKPVPLQNEPDPPLPIPHPFRSALLLLFLITTSEHFRLYRAE